MNIIRDPINGNYIIPPRYHKFRSPILESEYNYILRVCSFRIIQDIADDMGRTYGSVYRFLKEKNITPYRNRREPGKNYDWLDPLLEDLINVKFMTLTKISKEYNVPYERVKEKAEAQGLDYSYNRLKRYPVKKWEKLYDAGLSANAIGDLYGVRSTTVTKCFNDDDFEMRPKGKAISLALRKKMENPTTEELLPFYRSMHCQLKHNVPLEFLLQYELYYLRNFNLKYPKPSTSQRYGRKITEKDELTDEEYMRAIEYYMQNDNFIRQCEIQRYFEDSDMSKHHQLSFDHRMPMSKGGHFNDPSNVEPMSWHENRGKGELTMEQYVEIEGFYHGHEAKLIVAKRYGVDLPEFHKMTKEEFDAIGSEADFFYAQEDTE